MLQCVYCSVGGIKETLRRHINGMHKNQPLPDHPPTPPVYTSQGKDDEVRSAKEEVEYRESLSPEERHAYYRKLFEASNANWEKSLAFARDVVNKRK